MNSSSTLRLNRKEIVGEVRERINVLKCLCEEIHNNWNISRWENYDNKISAVYYGFPNFRVG